jgi:CheY-like chemotaxis protein
MQEVCSAHHLKILLIEDNSADARLVEALLAECEDMALRWVTGLDAALAELARTSFDAILLDLLLPDARGADLIETVHAAAPEAAIIVSSGQAAGDCLLAQALIRKGAEDFLPKAGLSPALLARTLTTAVERRRSTVALRTRMAQLEAALADARIGHLSWTPGAPDVAIAGDLAGLLGMQSRTARRSLRALLRDLSSATRQSLYAAWRELAAGAERLAVVLVEHESGPAGLGHDLLVEAVAQRDAGGRIVRLDALVRDTAMIGHVERLEGEMITHLGHALRTPLTSIRGALGLLAHGDDLSLAAWAQPLVENAIANADRISRVIGETLEPSGGHQPGPPRQPGPQTQPCPQYQPCREFRPGRQVKPRRVPLGAHLYDALAARVSGAAGVTTTGSSVGLTLTPASRSIEVMVDAARLRRAVDCLFARLVQSRGPSDCLALDVTLRGGVAWLAVEPLGDAPEARPRAPEAAAAAPRPSPQLLGRGAAGLRIAVPLAA